MFALVRRPASAPFLRCCEPPGSALPVILHVLLYALLCLIPALVLLPLQILDRQPRNEITHESGEEDRDPDGLLAAA